MLSEKLPSKLQLLFASAIWFLIWCFFQTIVIYGVCQNMTFALADAAISMLLVSIGISLIYFLQRFSGSYFNRLPTRLTFMVFIIIVVVWGQQLFLTSFDSQIANQELLRDTLWIRIMVAFSQISFASVLIWLLYFIKKESAKVRQKQEAENMLKQAELIRLRQQLQPHFLFNSLNSINSLMITEPQQARKMILNLSDFLRGTLKEDENKSVLLSEEINLLRLYLEIEKVRFGHRLNIKFDIEEACLNLVIPPLLLQPIVENAIKFGLYNVLEDVEISIEAKRENNQLKINITNPFDESTTQSKKGEGFGLSLIQKRLLLLYHRTDLLKIEKTDSKFTTLILIPQV